MAGLARVRAVCPLALAAALALTPTSSRAQMNYVVLHSFAPMPRSGEGPAATLAMDAAGNLYGTTPQGGSGDEGVVFRLDAAGRQRVLHTFTGGADGGRPKGGVVLDAAGNLYGATHRGGAWGYGAVYKISAQGVESVLYSFTGGTDGGYPTAGVTLDSSGNLYGTAGAVVFKLDPEGGETVLYTFAGGTDGTFPVGSVVLDSAGNLYGTTESGGSAGYGVVYRLDTAGNLILLHTFAGGVDGADPQAGLLLDAAGNLYGTTADGGFRGAGVVFKVDAAGQYSVLYTFTGGQDGSHPYAALTSDSAGNLYGTTLEGGGWSYGTVFKLDAAGAETVLYAFTGRTDGGEPYGGVILDAAGNIYGTAATGEPGVDEGVVYELDPAGQETVLYTFMGGMAGTRPDSGVILDAAGNLYGTTYFGGAAAAGTVYKFDMHTGRETVLHSFGGPADGAFPMDSVVVDSSGNLYGTTTYGGSSNAGVVFKLDSSGAETILHNFTGGEDGASPEAGLTLDSAGNLYGTTVYGGAANAGVVFKVSPVDGESVVYAFSGGDDGANPSSGLTPDPSGNLYGVTSWGGAFAGGVIYELDPAGNFMVVHSFTSSEGYNPAGSLAMDSDGNLYGTLINGGNNAEGLGIIYKLAVSGELTVLHSFASSYDGEEPNSGVILDAAGNVYGTTLQGGPDDDGTVFKIDASGQFSDLFTFPGGTGGFNPQGGLILNSAGDLLGTASGGGNVGGLIFELTGGNASLGRQ